jgi:hypothetical protein
MAIGDLAAAQGMPVLAGTEDIRASYVEINRTRDFLAEHETGGTHNATAINSGTLDVARIPNLDAAKVTTGTLATARIPSLDASKITTGTINRSVSTTGSGRFGAAWDNNITTTRRAVWMEADGTLGHTASSRRYKNNERPLVADLDELLKLQPTTFDYLEGGATDSGLIAEDLDKIGGAQFCVDYNTDGTVEGIHYDRLTVLLLALAQRQQAELSALTARLDALEQKKEI